MTEIITQNFYLMLMAAFGFGLCAGVTLMGLAGADKCDHCLSAKKHLGQCAKREQARIDALGK